jgi:CheY-like chemotaxis protein/predicted regulator of Ras-like GTPase activity (Roadblock/LC7/MglB family)
LGCSQSLTLEAAMADAPKKVLIVDDEEILTWIMSKTLSKDKKRYEVLVANDGNKALEIMQSVPVDLVITDIRMPGMSGLDLLEEIREKYPETKVIIMTAYGNPEVQKEANERGCLHYLEKPFKIEDLRNLILDAIKVNRKGFVGRVADLQLTDIIQLNCLGKMKSALSVSKDDLEGVIYFQDGEIVHAECGGHTGENALFEILGWEGGDFTTISGAEPLEKTIDRPWQELLIEAMRRKDEGKAQVKEGAAGVVDLVDTDERGKPLRGDEEDEEEGAVFDAAEIDYETGQPRATLNPPPVRSPVSGPEQPLSAPRAPSVVERIPKEVIEEPKPQRPRSMKEKAAMMQRLLVEWQRETEEIQGAAVVTLDGLTLGAHVAQGGITGDQLGALTASIYKVGSKGLKALRRGALEELYLKGAQGSVHLYLIDSRAILSVLARPDANMGMVHMESRERCKRLGQIFSM